MLVADGVAYFAAGMIDHDGTYLFAIDAVTGALKWQNNSTGHLNAGIRKGISAQGNLTIHDGRLILAGGNQISPAPFDLKTGKCLVKARSQGRPQSNHGRYVGVLGGKVPVAGGRILFSSPRNVSSKGSFEVHTAKRRLRLNFGGIPPAWNTSTVALVNFKHGLLTCCDTSKVLERINAKEPAKGSRGTVASDLSKTKAIRWQSSWVKATSSRRCRWWWVPMPSWPWSSTSRSTVLNPSGSWWPLTRPPARQRGDTR
ncbi:MAG: hypothetical protein CM1200mP2_30850 [Planctomycetaceae bacterium]|nr:MAG: hypothetical protein CM1200mP2_30850 [Planctomycetaceae bacterium]